MTCRVLFLAIVVFLVVGVADADPPQPAAPKNKELLRWKFTKGAVFRYNLKLHETFTVDGQQLQNKRNFVIRWTVRDVSLDGTANIGLAFERVILDLEVPKLHFDSSRDRAGGEPTNILSREQYYLARAKANTECTFRANVRGGSWGFVGDEAIQLVQSAMMFSPGDWPALPETPVGKGDSWTAQVGFSQPTGVMEGKSANKVLGVRKVDNRSIVEIETTTDWKNKFAGKRQYFPTKETCEFDNSSGAFLKRRVKLHSTGRAGNGQPFVLQIDTTSRLLPTSVVSSWQPRSPMQLLQSKGAPRILALLHSGWIGKNRAAAPDLSEFRATKTQFFEDEKFCVALVMEGVKAGKLRFDLVSGQGEKLMSGDIPLKNENMWANREFGDEKGTGLVPGMYFLEWYLDNRFFAFTPVHIVKRPNAEAKEVTDKRKPKTVREFIKRGTARGTRAEFEKALSDFTEAIRLDPKNEEAYRLRAGIHYRLQNYEAAVADTSAMIALNPTNANAHLLRAMSLKRMDKLDAALTDATAAIRLNSKSASPLILRGELLAMQGKYEKAMSDFDDALELDPRRPRTYRERGLVWFVMQEFDKCIADESKAIRLDPNDAEAYFRRGLAWQHKDQFDKAIRDFDDALRRNVSEPKFYLQRGILFAKRGKLDKALADLDAAIQLNGNLPSYHLRGDLLAKKGDFERSIADHSEVIKMDSRDAEAWMQRGIAYLAINEPEKGIADLTESLSIQPDNYAAWCARGDAWIYKAEFQKSLDDHTEAIRLQPEIADAYHHRGATRCVIGEYAGAIGDFEQAIDLDPRMPYTHHIYSLLLSSSPDAKLRDGQRAVELAKEAGDLLQWRPAKVWSALAAAHAETGNFEEALKAQDKAIQRMPNDKELIEQRDLYRQEKPWRNPRWGPQNGL